VHSRRGRVGRSSLDRLGNRQVSTNGFLSAFHFAPLEQAQGNRDARKD
jgi:hypothetical protein